MGKILIIKTSSLGDIVHNLPVITDICRNLPGSSIDWLVEEAYQPLVRLHPGVGLVVPVSMRRWRRQPLAAATWREIGALRRFLAENPYDSIIDTQGLFKSAVLAAAARGQRHGYDTASAREPIAAWLYDVRHAVSRSMHAVVRNRELGSCALGYGIGPEVDYGLAGVGHAGSAGGRHEFVFLHSTSRADKHWNETLWVELGQRIEALGGRVVLPWGAPSERLRSKRIAASLHDPGIPEALSIGEVAYLLGRSSGVVGLDTGLTHLAAALGMPVVAIYCSTDPGLTGVYGASRARNLGAIGQPPGVTEVMDALRSCGAL